MNTLKIGPRIQAIVTGMIVAGLAAFIRVVAAQGSDGTPTPTFSIEPVSLIIGVVVGAVVIGVPVLARSASHRKVKGEQCDDGNAGSQATAKGKKRPGRESPTLASAGKTSLRESPTLPSKGQTGLRESPTKASTGQTKIADGADAISKPVEGDGKKHTKTGHVTLLK